MLPFSFIFELISDTMTTFVYFIIYYDITSKEYNHLFDGPMILEYVVKYHAMHQIILKNTAHNPNYQNNKYLYHLVDTSLRVHKYETRSILPS